ncbi:MAG: hypothetical protein EBY09_13735, partial [Verrucomicrobia bacterium]|nr:hypothetical protein [Verrucomicrobiota bacterium]NDD39522.1 hypothetical protein [Verrucomicrobiota bacterium]
MKAELTLRQRLRAWLPAVFWMALIFVASTDLGGTRHTSRFIVPLLRWLVPGLAQEALEAIHFTVRKSGHALGYAVLAGLIWRACRAGQNRRAGDWSWRHASMAFTLAACYAATDEWHQTFTATRDGSLADVVLDAAGAAMGLAAIGVW